MRILIWRGKHGDAYWDASTAKKETAALRRMFEAMEECGYYFYDEPSKETVTEAGIAELEKQLAGGKIPAALVFEAQQKIKDMKSEFRAVRGEREEGTLYKAAKKGDDKALKEFLQRRKDGEYEGWSFEDAEDPLKGRR